MFDRNELYKVYKISVPIIDMLAPYWNLYIRVGGIDIIKSIELPAEHSAVKDLCANAYVECKQNITDIPDKELFAIKESTSNQVLRILKDYIIESIYNKNNFDSTFIDNILFIIHKEDSLLCVTKGCDLKKMKLLLNKFLRKTNPIMLLLKAIDPSKKEGFDDMINKGIYEIEANNAIETAEIRCIYSPIYFKTDFCFSEDKYATYDLNTSEFWINHNLLLKEFQIEKPEGTDNAFGFSERTKDSILNSDGIFINNLIIPLVSDFKELYPQNGLNAIWREFKNGVYQHKPENSDNHIYKCNDEQKNFLELAKSENVTNSLSYLVNNLFVPHEYIEKIKAIDSFFNDIMIVDGLSELENYEFFSSHNDNNTPFIGIHKKDKAGSSSYKLLHYIYKEDNNLNNIRGHNQINKCNPKIAKVLKPNLAFYYLLRYYEDFFILALKEIKQKTSCNIDFIANQNLYINNSANEIDILAFNGTDIFMIELKTNLTIDYIVSYQKKCNKWLEHNSEIANNLKFIIVGNFGHETLNVCVDNNANIDGYNIPRANMNGCAYSFTVPLNNSHELYCFTESSFERLKLKLTKIFIKDEASCN